VRLADHSCYSQFVPGRCFVRVFRKFFILNAWRGRARGRSRCLSGGTRGGSGETSSVSRSGDVRNRSTAFCAQRSACGANGCQLLSAQAAPVTCMAIRPTRTQASRR
jgi:hypothetical protein